eukprot:scaffold14_cov380-Prasinococcus_capsulatus_cf.AAC.6
MRLCMARVRAWQRALAVIHTGTVTATPAGCSRKPRGPYRRVAVSSRRRPGATVCRSIKDAEQGTKPTDAANFGLYSVIRRSPLATLPNTDKLKFVDTWIGKLVNLVTLLELRLLQEYKVQPSQRKRGLNGARPTHANGVQVEAVAKRAGPHDTARVERELDALLAEHAVVVFSFSVCPWCFKDVCLSAKQLLTDAGIQYEVVEVDLLEGVRHHTTASTLCRVSRCSGKASLLTDLPELSRPANRTHEHAQRVCEGAKHRRLHGRRAHSVPGLARHAGGWAARASPGSGMSPMFVWIRAQGISG